MTYIIGIRKPEYNFLTIISDVMVTKSYPDGEIERENTALKTGYLFDGCIYGLAGDANAGHEFLSCFKQSINCKDNIKLNFSKLSDFANSHEWNPGTDFEILFGIRNPNPEFYLLNSSTKQFLLLDSVLYTMGSGKQLLDSIVNNAFQYANDFITKQLHNNGIPIVYYPCFICLWLSELTLGFEKEQLSNIGVGGIFHFAYQTDKKENRPLPIIFVLSKLEEQNLKQEAYRISFVNGYLIVENLSDKKTSAFTSEVERQDLNELELLDSKDILQEAYKRSRNLPIYYFCGFATHDPTYRGFYTMHLSCNDEKVIDWDGNVRSDFQDKIHRNLKIAM